MRKPPGRQRTADHVDPADVALVEAYIKTRFSDDIPSPIRKVLRVRRLGEHFGARIVLFDGGPCLLVVERKSQFFLESRWIYRGYPADVDDRCFLFHRSLNSWFRFGGTYEEALGIFGEDFA